LQRIGRDIGFIDQGAAGGGVGEAEKKVEDGGFPSSLRPEQTIDLARLDPLIERIEGQLTVGVALAEINGFNHEVTRRCTA
jgi:hypothetical protein